MQSSWLVPSHAAPACREGEGDCAARDSSPAVAVLLQIESAPLAPKKVCVCSECVAAGVWAAPCVCHPNVPAADGMIRAESGVALFPTRDLQ